MTATSYDQLKTQFTAVAGRPPTAEEAESLLRLKDALGIRYDDPVFSLLMAMENHKAYFKEIPEHLQRAANYILGDAQQQLQAEVTKAAEGLAAIHATETAKIGDFGKRVSANVVAESVQLLRSTVHETVIAEIGAIKGEANKSFASVRAAAELAANELHHVAIAARHQWIMAVFAGFAFALIAGIIAASAVLYVSNSRNNSELSSQERQSLAVGTRISEHWTTLTPTTRSELEKILKD